MEHPDAVATWSIPLQALLEQGAQEVLEHAGLVRGKNLHTGESHTYYEETEEEYHPHQRLHDFLVLEVTHDGSREQMEYLRSVVFLFKGVCLFPQFPEFAKVRKAQQRALFYDPRSNRTALLPTKKLKPGMIRAHLKSTGAEMWVASPPNLAKEVGHDSLSAHVCKQLVQICDALADSSAVPVKVLKDPSQSGQDHEEATEVLLRMIRCYLHFTEAWELDLPRKWEVMQVIHQVLRWEARFAHQTDQHRSLSAGARRVISALVLKSWWWCPLPPAPPGNG